MEKIEKKDITESIYSAFWICDDCSYRKNDEEIDAGHYLKDPKPCPNPECQGVMIYFIPPIKKGGPYDSDQNKRH